MQTTIASGYLPPSESLIQTAAKAANIKTKADSFILDVCNLNAAGRFMTAEELNTEIQHELETKYPIISTRIKNSPFQRTDTGKTYGKYSAAFKDFTDNKLELAGKTRHALETIPDSDVPGESPMERAVNLIQLLEAQTQQQDGEDGEDSPLTQLSDLLDKHNVSAAKKALDEAKGLSAKEKKLLSELSDIKKNKGAGSGKGKGEGAGADSKDAKAPEEPGVGGSSAGKAAGVKGKNVLELAVAISDRQLAEIIRISRKLKAISQLNTSKLVEFVPDSAGQEVRNKQMQNFNDVHKLKSSQFAQMTSNKALFNYRAVTNQYVIRERGYFKEKKQLLYVLIDCSGSMTDGGMSRVNIAAGVLVNRLMAVANGDAKLYWRFFDTKLHDMTFVEDKNQAYDSINTVLKKENYSGGGTNFNVALTGAVSHITSIAESLDIVKPEIFMVTDGDCSCAVKHKDLKGIKLHTAFVAYLGESSELKRLSRESGGVALQLT